MTLKTRRVLRLKTAVAALDPVALIEARTGFLCCALNLRNAAEVEEAHGIPRALVCVLESLEQASRPGAEPMRDAIRATVDQIAAAFVADHRDLSGVVPAVVLAELRLLPSQQGAVQAAIDAVIAGLDAQARGDVWDRPAQAAALAGEAADARGTIPARYACNAAIHATYLSRGVEAAAARSLEHARRAARHDGQDAETVIARQRDLVLAAIRGA